MHKVENYLAEYGCTMEKCKQEKRIEWLVIGQLLVNEHAWTKEGAACLIHLVRDYGSFMLGNAYALALVLKIDDGELGL